MSVNSLRADSRKKTPPIDMKSTYECKPDCIRVAQSRVPAQPIGSDLVPIGKLHAIPDSVKYGLKYNASNFYFRHLSPTYKVEDNKGINHKNARQIDICLAKYSLAVAEEMDTASACYTGVKHTLWNAGVINDYADMPLGNASDSIQYFDANPQKFQKVKVKKEDLKNLPAGMIVVYSKEGKAGHIAITNGNGQEMSDCTDNMAWLDKEGKGASFVVYKLTDNWEYDRNTMKLRFNKPS